MPTLSERAGGTSGMTSRASTDGMDVSRHPGALAAQQEDIAGTEGKPVIGSVALGRQQEQPPGGSPCLPARAA